MQHKSELIKLKKLISNNVYDLLKESNAIIAGGAITSLFCNREVNDVDVYFRSVSDFQLLIELLEHEYEYSLFGHNITNKSVLFRDNGTGQDVQVIVYKFFPTVEDIFNDFDFTCNMGAFEFSTEQFVFHDDFMKHNSQKYLEFNEKTAYPIISAIRVQKYTDKGYKISKPQFLKIMLTVAGVGIDSWEKLKDHVGGMYGLNLDKIFPESEEFSLDKAISILHEIEASAVDYPENNFTFDKLYDISALYGKEKDDRIVSDNIFFKNVERTNQEGIYQSSYDNNFKYVVGEFVNGGKRGVYACYGHDVLSAIYNENDCILELECKDIPPEHQLYKSQYQLMGDVKVVNAYTKSEFIRKFKRG